MDYIWKADLDGKFKCTVTRINKRGGTLRIEDTESGKTLLEQDVGLAYGAQFGPDIDDVNKWESICVAVVDRETK